MLLNCGVGKDSCKSVGPQGDPTSPSWRRSVLGVHLTVWCWSWNSNTLATWCEELTHLKRPCCWEGLGAGGEGDDRGWDGWMASLTQWTWVWVGSRSWCWTGRPGMWHLMGSQRVGHDWATELNWKLLNRDLDFFPSRTQEDSLCAVLCRSAVSNPLRPHGLKTNKSIAGGFFTILATKEALSWWLSTDNKHKM